MIRFKDNQAILDVLESVIDEGIFAFMCTTHDRIAELCQTFRREKKYSDLQIYPCMPYAHKYANALTEQGIMGTIKAICPR